MVAVLRVDATGETVGVVVGDAQSVVEVAGSYHGEDRTEDLLARYPSLRVHVAVDGRGHEVAALWVAGVFTQDPLALVLAGLDVAGDLLELLLAYDGTHLHVRVLGGADLEGASLFDHLIQHLVVDVLMQDGAGGGATLLATVAVGALHEVGGCGVQVSRVVYYHGVLTARLDDD